MVKTGQMYQAPVKCEPPEAHRRQWEIGGKSNVASSLPPSPSPATLLLAGFLVARPMGKMGG